MVYARAYALWGNLLLLWMHSDHFLPSVLRDHGHVTDKKAYDDVTRINA